MTQLDRLALKMIAFDAGDARRIQHLLKVHSLARLIALEEGMAGDALFTLEAAALTHDIGIHPAERKHGYCNGKLQELEGPPVARELLAELGFAPQTIERVCFLIAHHHTYTGVDAPDWRILLEADALVNLYEDGADAEAIAASGERVFETAAGKRLLREMFDGAEGR